jgi:predicted DNA-binding mobile mystery protein A
MEKADFARLKRKQIDDMLSPLAGLQIRYPKSGWLKSVRTALGMTLEQLGTRLNNTSKQAAAQLEKNELDGSITLAKLRAAAEALECELIVALRPKAGSTENALRQQAVRKARNIHSDVVHTMALEAQTEGIDQDADLSSEVQWWLAQNSARLWD